MCTVAWYGALNTLAITLLKFASPGVPDLYQGQDTVDFSLVDPDNRRPVDFAQRQRALEAMQEIAAADDAAPRVAKLCTEPADGHAKTWITWRALQLRRAHPSLFGDGDYAGLSVNGARARQVVSFARRKDDEVLIVATGRLFAQLGCARGELPTGAVWNDTTLTLPPWGHNLALRDALSGRVFQPNGVTFELDELFSVLPFVLLHGQTRPLRAR